MNRLAILAGQGSLPNQLAAAHAPALFVTFEGLDVSPPDNEHLHTSYERFGEMFDGLSVAGVTEVVFAGGLARPQLNPANFDAKMMQLAPRFMAAMQGGDDGLLRAVIAAFEEHGFAVRGAHELLPGLTCAAGLLTGPEPSDADRKDIARARDVLSTLGPLDVGQGAVVAGGQVLGIETAQGTDAMLRFVAETPEGLRRGKGVLVKAPKPGQDLRVDMPAVGPKTVEAAAKAGLAGLVLDAGQVVLLEREETLRRAKALGVFILAEEP
ncbi:UDP-2,3-diacylglucosamine pyrophosphatase [Candidatus Rhodobacter oscarellae]|uniref:UDP-2,3-diacylglucosamine pyrophosphatase n=1 Tax=Candidatus Rhodobacter oscarellae TaxID=1675527 RepID=A0A0J9E398_9RHOB|nr:UDP-2,3-diacylglucosamine diphosphatase LpxI [Candidatus Rhodobacter lobularis]KMW57291.1 UDP-2,3-diacylglucosamine pyrophosphatase [Candidatus Rhodobacter lobularis]